MCTHLYIIMVRIGRDVNSMKNVSFRPIPAILRRQVYVLKYFLFDYTKNVTREYDILLLLLIIKLNFHIYIGTHFF